MVVGQGRGVGEKRAPNSQRFQGVARKCKQNIAGKKKIGAGPLRGVRLLGSRRGSPAGPRRWRHSGAHPAGTPGPAPPAATPAAGPPALPRCPGQGFAYPPLPPNHPVVRDLCPVVGIDGGRRGRTPERLPQRPLALAVNKQSWPQFSVSSQ